MEVRGKKSLVVGAGKSGISAARFLSSQGAEVVLNDMKDLGSLGDLEKEGIRLEGGGHPPEIFRDAELVIISPGVPSGSGNLGDMLREAESRGVEIISELELAARFVDAPIIAVAGTNGKSTTTMLLRDMLACGGKRVFAGGNLGTPLSQYLLDGDRADIVVVEVSSFQLERIKEFKPYISIMLNVTADHLDRYPSMEAYLEAKKRLFENQTKDDYAILNVEDEITSKFATDIGAGIIPFGKREHHKGGVYRDNDAIVSDIDGCPGRIEGSLLKKIGLHNRGNVMAAFAAALLCGVTEEAAARAVEGFSALSHRMEYVDEFCGVRFYDDSKATNVGALSASLEGVDGHIILIAGGKDKGGSYEPLRKPVRERVKGLVLIGEAAERMKAVLGEETKVSLAATMDEAVEQAWRLAGEGDIVLLSPACSSFDMFENFAARGDAFKKAVARVASGIDDNGKEAALAC